MDLEIKELNTQIRRAVIPDAVIGRLEEKEIKTLKDIRRKGGIPRFEDVPPEEEKALKKVEAHAYISLVSDDLKVNEKLIDAGFRNTADISRLTRNDFVVKAKGEKGRVFFMKSDILTFIKAELEILSADGKFLSNPQQNCNTFLINFDESYYNLLDLFLKGLSQGGTHPEHRRYGIVELRNQDTELSLGGMP